MIRSDGSAAAYGGLWAVAVSGRGGLWSTGTVLGPVSGAVRLLPRRLAATPRGCPRWLPPARQSGSDIRVAHVAHATRPSPTPPGRPENNV